MTGMPQQDALLVMWLTFSAVAILAVIAILVWAMRSHQFSRQDRARYLALQSGIPPESDSGHDKSEDKHVSA
jgi:nitrogen fixation-related uncharacterized protein